MLSSAWAEESERDRLRAVLTETKDNLPVVEVAILAIVCMYGMYPTGHWREEEIDETTTRKPDGSFESQETINYADPTGPLNTIVNIFRHSGPRIVEDPEADK